ncbi:Uncharacterized protein dnl_00470 [Desulfonema limicola]|uniref:STAS/SEC14 domain-containing protein n=1 Tax=Desulfonema limicola TaxID=45656 RepID=A0A975GE81_9BACT|nr:hypothetical protein [Desulfonema limicola]QTA77849.1 Uncharacterized protein dnl_00470 [Desulfonema limicola]
MSTLHINKNLPFNDLLKVIAGLNTNDLEKLASEVILLRAQRKSPSLSKKETELFLKLNAGLPLRIRKRFAELNQKRKTETLTPAEHKELINLTERIEKSNADRIFYMSKIANLRGISLLELMEKSEFLPIAHG